MKLNGGLVGIIGVHLLVSDLISAPDISGINSQPLVSINYNLPFQSLIQKEITISCLCVIVSPTQDWHQVDLLMS